MQPRAQSAHQRIPRMRDPQPHDYKFTVEYQYPAEEDQISAEEAGRPIR